MKMAPEMGPFFIKMWYTDSMTEQDVLEFLNGDNPGLIEEFRKFYAENSYAISRRKSNGSELSDVTLACRTIAYLSKSNPILAQRLGNNPTETVYSILTKEKNVCPRGNTKRFYGSDRGFAFCGTNGACQCQSEAFLEKTKNRSEAAKQAIIAKRSETNDKRFGGHPSRNPSVRQKTKTTTLERYGVEYSLQNEEVKRKSRETNLKKYGHEYSLRSSEVKKKIEATREAKYGGHHLKNETVQQNRKKTNLGRYGYEHACKNPEVRKKISESSMQTYQARGDDIVSKRKSTNKSIYGTECSLQNPDVLAKSKATIAEKYGVNHPTQHPSVRDKISMAAFSKYPPDTQRLFSNKNLLEEFLADKSLETAANLLGVDPTTVAKYRNNLGISLPNKSGYEVELHSFLQSIGEPFQHNVRSLLENKKLELDFFLPDHNLAIEFDGLYWHSEAHRDNDYHRRKFEECEKSNIRLIVIREDEWIERHEIIKSKILNILGKSLRGPGARKLTIRAIDASEAADFCNVYHLQGQPHGITLAIGAYDQEHLVAVMTFGLQRNTRKVELTRYCTDGKTYAGIFSKMFKYVIDTQPFVEIISFADLRYSIGNLYRKTGFAEEQRIRPDYRYVYGNKSFHKSNFTLSKIAKKFNVDTTGKTERELMRDANYLRIYDCGKIRFVWRR